MLLAESSHFTFVYDDPEYSLVVLNACPEHSGVYTCTAKNLAGSNSCKAEVTVHTGLLSNRSLWDLKLGGNIFLMIHCKSLLY